MNYYILFLALAYSVTRKGMTAYYGTAVLATVPQFLVVFSSLVALGLALGFPVFYPVLLLSALSIAFMMYGFNVRVLKRHWKVIEQMRQGRKPAWLTYTAVVALAYAYAALVVISARQEPRHTTGLSPTNNLLRIEKMRQWQAESD